MFGPLLALLAQVGAVCFTLDMLNMTFGGQPNLTIGYFLSLANITINIAGNVGMGIGMFAGNILMGLVTATGNILSAFGNGIVGLIGHFRNNAGPVNPINPDRAIQSNNIAPARTPVLDQARVNYFGGQNQNAAPQNNARLRDIKQILDNWSPADRETAFNLLQQYNNNAALPRNNHTQNWQRRIEVNNIRQANANHL